MNKAVFTAGVCLIWAACAQGADSFVGEPQREDGCSTAAPAFDSLIQESPGFSPRNSYVAMWLSQTIELPESVIWERLLQVPLEDSHLVKRGKLGVQAGVFRIGGKVFVVFRGTQDIVDYFDNVMIAPASGAAAGLPGKVHAGFRENFLNIWPEVYDAALGMGAIDTGVWVMGHSLGGALGQFAAYNFAQKNIDVHGVFGSGVPLPGNSQYQKTYNALLGAKTFIVGFEDDITPNVPPVPEAAEAFAVASQAPLRALVRDLALRMDYQQVGAWFHLTRKGELSPVESLAEYQSAYYAKMRADNAKVGLPMVLVANNRYVNDHTTEYYRCAMQEFVSRLR